MYGKAGAHVDAGTVTLGERNVKDYDMDSLMENCSFVFQSVYLFHDTIANNIRFGQPDAPMEKVVEAAKKACCHEFIEVASRKVKLANQLIDPYRR